MKKLLKNVGFYFSLVTIISILFFLFKINGVGILPAKIFIPIALILICIVCVVVVLWIKAKKMIAKIILSILSLCLIFSSVVGVTYIDKTLDSIMKVSSNDTKMKKTISVYALKLSAIQDKEDLKGRTIGVLENNNRENVNLCLDKLGFDVNVKEYSSSLELVEDFKGQAIDCICIDQMYLDIIEDYDGYENFEDDIREVYSYVYYIEKENEVSDVDVSTEPFSVLISGIDTRTNSFDDVDGSRSDVNLVVTINPTTRKVLLLSIPRDYYVETVCDAVDGCAIGQKDKLTHTGWHGISTTEKTIENLLGIEINYNVKVNFNTLSTLVDLLGGIDVYSNQYLANAASSGCVVNEGWNHFDGKCALAYSRERKAYADGDRQRGKNQMQVITAIIKKMVSPDLLMNFSDIMDSMDELFQTNMDMNKLFALVKKQLSDGGSWSIYQYSLNGTGGSDFAYELGMNAYVMYPDQSTIDNAIADIQSINNGETPPYVNAKDTTE
ncbi:MAG: LCP family protein [Erysipelotrichaceae bacterium]|nr:LCP family protein [Erysipelotrichaceae bacterium]